MASAVSPGVPAQGAAFVGSPHEAQARQLAQAGGAADVYAFLASLEGQYAGDPEYDYALGTSALDAGHASQAIFALQRAVAARPGYAGARMELARAYFTLGDNESARREFAILEQSRPPPLAQRAIAEYQAAIDRRAAAYRFHGTGHVELAGGYDSNANGAPDIQSFLGIPLDGRNQSTASSYYAVGLGGLVSYPFAPGWRLVGTGNASYRGNPDATFVDAQALRVAGGVEWRPGAIELSLRPNYAMVLLDGEDNHRVAGVDASGTWHGGSTRWSLNARSSQARYTDGLEVLDVDTLIFGLAGHLTRSRVQWLGVVTFGADDAVESGSPFGRDIVGARIGAIVDLGRSHAMLASLASVSSDYEGSFPGSRSDDQFAATLGYEWGGLRARGWTLGAQLNYVDNQSTIVLYDYDRLEAGLSVRKEFR